MKAPIDQVIYELYKHFMREHSKGIVKPNKVFAGYEKMVEIMNNSQHAHTDHNGRKHIFGMEIIEVSANQYLSVGFDVEFPN